MTAVVERQNNMAHEFDKEVSYVASTNNEVTQDNGSESKLDAKEENVKMAPTTRYLESMGLQEEAEDDTVTENLNTSKSSSKRRSSDHKEKEIPYCQKLLGEVTQSQQDAIDRISTLEGLKQMKKWLEDARSAKQDKRLGFLLAQCWKAKIDVDVLTDVNIGKLVRELKKYPDNEIQTAATEVLKKWKQAVADDASTKASAAMKAASASKVPASKIVTSASKSVAPAPPSVASKPSTSTPIVPKSEKKNVSVSRPKTARTKNTAFRKTGFEEDEEEEPRGPPSKKPAPTILSQLSTPITKPTVQFPKKSAVPSNSFMNALSAGASVNAVELQRKRKKLPPVIDLPLSSPMEPVAVVTTPTMLANVVEADPNGPNPGRVPAPGTKRRIHFADDKGQELVLIKYIENVLHSKSHRTPSDMKHADAEAERISLKQMKTDVEEEDDDEEMKPEMQNMGHATAAAVEVDNTWDLIPYFKTFPKQYCQELFKEEENRYEHVMRTFVSEPDVPVEHPSEPDDVNFAYTKEHEPENIPADFVMDETSEQEPMDVDAPASPDTSSSAHVQKLSPSYPATVSPHPTQPTVSQAPAMPVNNFQILNNVDIHGSGQIHLPRQPVPFPLNPPIYSVPPPSLPSRPPPQPVPAPSAELIILADQPSKLNAPRLSNSGIDATSLLEKFKGKGKSLDDILGKVKGTKAPPPSTAAASTIPQNFNVPPPTNFSVPPPQIVKPVPPPSAGDFQILNNIDIHSSQAFAAAPRQPGPGMPRMRGARQQQQTRPPQSSGVICTYFLKGTCTYGNNCFNEHRHPQQNQMNQMGYRAPGPQYPNNRGGGSLRGRFNPAANKAPFNSSNKNSEISHDQDNSYRPRKRNDDYRRGRRGPSRSPSPRRGRRRSRSISPERYRRRRSRSPHSRSESPDEKEGYRRRRRSPMSSRSPSRSPLPSPSPSPNRS